MKQCVLNLLIAAGLPPDHLCGALLWHIRAKGEDHLLRQELQPAYFHVLHSLHPGWPRPRRPTWAVQTQNHLDNISCLPLHKDPDQRYPQGGGGFPLGRDHILLNAMSYHHPVICRLFWSLLRWQLRTCRRRRRSWPLPPTKTPQILRCCRWFCRAVWARLSTRFWHFMKINGLSLEY